MSALYEFQSQCNNHGLRMENHQVPLVLWQSNLHCLPDDPELVNLESYGVGYEGPLPKISTSNNVIVPESLQLNEEQYQELQQRVNALADDGNRYSFIKFRNSSLKAIYGSYIDGNSINGTQVRIIGLCSKPQRDQNVTVTELQVITSPLCGQIEKYGLFFSFQGVTNLFK